MYNILKRNIFFYLSIILAVGNIYLFFNNINKKDKIAGLEAQIQDLDGEIDMVEGERQEEGKTENDVAELEEEIQNLENVIENMREQKKQEVSEKWEALAFAKYIRLAEKEQVDQNLIASFILKENGMENTKGVELNAVYPMRVEDVDGEIYLFRYYADDKDEISVGNYCAIWIDQQTNSSKILFNTEGNHEFTSLYEFYDMQVRDVDGNEEEDVILLSGAHRSAGAGYYLPDLYCMIALQKNNKFQCISQESEDWLGDVLHPLYSQQNESRKIENIIEEIMAHYGNEEIKIAVEEGAALEDFIAVNDEKMLEKLEQRSLFFERELLWETYDVDENDHIQGIKVYKENGENGMPQTQVAVYLFDYVTEEVEKLEVPEVYQEITDQGETIEDVELEEIEVKEIDGVKNICMKVEIVLWGGTRRLPYELCIK